MKFSNKVSLNLSLQEAVSRVRLVVMDVDGVMTDGGTYVLENGDQFLRFNVQDSMALTVCGMSELKMAVISGRDLPCVKERLGRFKIDEVRLGVLDKLGELKDVCRKLGVSLEEVCYIGDDLIDIPVLEAVGFPVAVPNAIDEVRQIAAYTTELAGGQGAVRELITLILKVQGAWDKTAEAYLTRHT